jgi:hypothetical protein
MLEEFDDAKVVPIDIKPEWNITGSLLEGFTEPVYRFIPGITRSEGLFVCVLRKGRLSPAPSLDREGRRMRQAVPQVITPLSTQRGVGGESVNLTYQQAIAYLRGEALVLPDDTPRGIVEVCFMGMPLGQVKNIGSRANNLYPKPWRIKTTHIPDEYVSILANIS